MNLKLGSSQPFNIHIFLIHRTLILLLLILFSCTKKESATFRCSNYNWSSVEQLVFPYLDEDMQTTMTMQAQSSEYHISAAADFALTFGEDFPDSVVSLLKKIEGCE